VSRVQAPGRNLLKLRHRAGASDRVAARMAFGCRRYDGYDRSVSQAFANLRYWQFRGRRDIVRVMHSHNDLRSGWPKTGNGFDSLHPLHC